MVEKSVNLDFLLKVLNLTAEIGEQHSLWWRTDGQYSPVTIFVLCNDQFTYGTADCEELTPDNINLFEEASNEIRGLQIKLGIDKMTAESYIPMLFIAKVRKSRPNFIRYPKDERFWPLFDACGPERGIKENILITKNLIKENLPKDMLNTIKELWIKFINFIKELFEKWFSKK